MLTTYLRQPEVRDEIVRAREIFLQAPPIAASFVISDRNVFAFALWKSGENDQAAEELKAIGVSRAQMPWALAGDPATVFAKARAECLGEGDEAVSAKMTEAAATAVEAAKKSGEVLDFSWESLDVVEQLLRAFQPRVAQMRDDAERNKTIFGVA